MINRRGALAAIAAAAFGAEVAKTPGDGLRADLARLGAHVYSEEGIPMFLACKNLAGKPNSPALAPSDLNQKVASSFHRYASEWQRIHPDAPAADVAKIVELLADRDFTSGGNEKSL